MNQTRFCSLHPEETDTPDEFFYGDMRVYRKQLGEDDKTSNSLKRIFSSYVNAGIFPTHARLTGDYLEHSLARPDNRKPSLAGRYLGVVFADGSYQYLRLDGESIGVSRSEIHPPGEITILTDTCLFCAANATATLVSGETVSIVSPSNKLRSQISGLNISEDLCPYEVDSVTRLTDLISAIAPASQAFHSVTLAMPTVEYYLYLIDAYNNRLLSRDMMDHWITRVGQHADKISALITAQIPLKTESCQPLNPIRAYIERCISNNEPASFAYAFETLSNANAIWREVLTITSPKNWQELNYSNYIVSLLETAYTSEGNNRLVIDIENPSEQRILRNASKAVKQMSRHRKDFTFSIIGIYPHEKVFITGGECSGTFPRLYYLPQELAKTTDINRIIIEANRRKMVY